MKSFLLGFLFGTAGLYVLSALSLVFSVVEKVSTPLMWPGRYAAELFAGTEGSDFEVVILIIGNGVLYGLAFLLLAKLFRKKAANS